MLLLTPKNVSEASWIDVIIINIQMPGKSWFEILSHEHGCRPAWKYLAIKLLVTVN